MSRKSRRARKRQTKPATERSAKAAEQSRAPEPPPKQRRPPLLDSRRNRLIISALSPVVVLVLGLGGFFLFIPRSTVQADKMAALLPSDPFLAGLTKKPAYSSSIPILPMSIDAVTKAANDDPGHTGAYSRQWFGAAKSGMSEDLVLYLLPSPTIAKQVEELQQRQNTSSAALKSSGYQLKSDLALSAPSATGASYVIPASTQSTSGQPLTSKATDGITLIQQEGRVVVRSTLQAASLSKADAQQLAQQVHNVLDAKLASFPSLEVTHLPVISSTLYLIVLGLLVVLVALLPTLISRYRVRVAAHNAARATYHYRARGSKNLKRYKTPY